MKKYGIFIADDEIWIRKGLAKKIDWDSLPVTFAGEAEDTEDALLQIQNVRPRILIADVRIPPENGIVLAMKARTLVPDLRVIVVSSFDNFEYARRSIEIPALSYLLKPVERNDLNDKIQKAVQELNEQEALKQFHRIQENHRTFGGDKIVREAVRYMENNVDGEMTLTTVAERFNLNPTYFSTLFKEQSGQSFKDFITEVKMMKSRELLLTTELTVREVGHKLGYWDSRYFSRKFKERFSMTPAEFRKDP